jgi:Protein of unknown function (DUF3501)
MRKLALDDILGPARYAAARDEMRRQIIDLKRPRRVSVGPQITLVFENRETMRFQIEEMCRAEGITDPAKIQHEIDTYNQVLPDDGQLGATLFIEVQSDAALRRVLDQLVGLQDHVALVVEGRRAGATFDQEQFTADKLAAVQYIKFPLDPASREALGRPGADVRLTVDHPNYRHEARLSEETRASLAGDLALASGGCLRPRTKVRGAQRLVALRRVAHHRLVLAHREGAAGGEDADALQIFVGAARQAPPTVAAVFAAHHQPPPADRVEHPGPVAVNGIEPVVDPAR